MNLFSLAKKINRPLILDGAMGSLLQQMNIKSKGSLWMSYANIENPEKVYSIHKKYIKAGADIITTNTFRTNPASLREFTKLKSERLVKASVNLAIKAKGNLPILVAGSNAPGEDCYQEERTISNKELSYNHKKHIDLLMSAGCDFILNETQSHIDEIKIIVKHCYRQKIPYVISFFFKDNLQLLSGENLFDIVKLVLEFNPLAIGFNCITPKSFRKVLKKVSTDYNWGFYLNCGGGNYTDEIIKCSVSPKQYIPDLKLSLNKKPSFFGACCGSSPLHIKEIKNFLDGRIKN
jgi:methionine synthase I (cobalamin-dependent)